MTLMLDKRSLMLGLALALLSLEGNLVVVVCEYTVHDKTMKL